MRTRKESRKPVYLTTEHIRKELTRRKVNFPSWGKRKTLLDIYNRNVGTSKRKQASREETLVNLSTSRLRDRRHHAMDQSETDDEEEIPELPARRITPPGAQVQHAEEQTAPNSWDIPPGESPSHITTRQSAHDVTSMMAEIAAMKRTIEDLQSDAHARITSEVGRLSTNGNMTLRADENRQMYQESSGFSLQSIMGPPTQRCILPGTHQPSQGVDAGERRQLLSINQSQRQDLGSASGTINHNFSDTTTRSRPSDRYDEIGNVTIPCNQSSTYNALGVASDSLPHVDIVNPSVRKDIISGKDINLASLLIPGYKSDSTLVRHLVQGSEVIPLKSLNDTRLSRTLTLSEFIMAFGIYKNIMCEAYPQRRIELDAYELIVVEMAHKFGGTAFYDYHRAFSARAAAMLQNFQIKINWALKDTNLFCLSCLGHSVIPCGICSAKDHTTHFCPQAQYPNNRPGRNGRSDNFHRANSAASNSKQNMTNPSIDRQGRIREFHAGSELCNNFNTESGCPLKNCFYRHICKVCKKPHPMQKCPQALAKVSNQKGITKDHD